MKTKWILIFAALFLNFSNGNTQNYALDFDGTNDYVLIPHHVQLCLMDSFTIEAWINANVWKPQQWAGTIIGKDGDHASWGSCGYVLRTGNNGMGSFVIGNNGWPEALSQPIMKINKWYHIAGVYAGNELRLYINGELKNTVALSAPMDSSFFNLKIGESGNFSGRVFNGKIDEVRLWNCIRTAAQIKANMMHELNGNESGLVAYYNFNEGAGKILHDITLNNHNGTLTNMDTTTDWVAGWQLANNDVGVAGIITPYTGPVWTSHEIVQVSVTNFAFDTIANFNISYQINDGAIVTESVTASLKPAERVNYTFNRVVNLLNEDTVKIKVFTSLSGDTDPSNDTVVQYIYKTNIIVPFYRVQHDFAGNGQTHSRTLILPEDNSMYSQILMHVSISCPTTGCDPWDQPAKIILNKNGHSYEIGRYITSYRTACGPWTIDVTDFKSLLRGEVELISYVQVWGASGWLVTIQFEFVEGESEYEFSKVEKLWNEDYWIYGDTAISYNLPEKKMYIENEVEDATIRMTISGHGQGNTQNAAEFSHMTHHVWIDGVQKFAHDLWKDDCNVNPCSPQQGTWQYSRAGWCPGQQVIPVHFSLDSLIEPGDSIAIDYVLQNYTNYLNTGYNGSSHTEPHYRIHSYLIKYSNTALIDFNDASLTAIILPQTVLVNNAQIAVVVENKGTQPISNFELIYYYNNETIYTESVTQLINPGENYTHQLSHLFNFASAALNDVFTAVVKIENDEKSGNNALNIQLDGSYLKINEVLNLPVFVVYPNPSDGQFTIKADKITDNVNLSIYDIFGKKVYDAFLFPENKGIQHNMNCNHFTNGMYFVKFQTSAGIKVEKIQIQK